MIAASILYFILICMGFTVSATNTKLLWHLSQREISFEELPVLVYRAASFLMSTSPDLSPDLTTFQICAHVNLLW